jgi:membrane-bound lytic murein transglycosylase D
MLPRRHGRRVVRRVSLLVGLALGLAVSSAAGQALDADVPGPADRVAANDTRPVPVAIALDSERLTPPAAGLPVTASLDPPPGADPVRAVESLAEAQIDVPLNAKVLSFVRLFSGRLKGYIEGGLERGAQFLPMIREIFRAEGLPEELVFVPLVESAFKPTALSRAKAKGVWQFIPSTGREHGLRRDWYVDERSDVEKSTRAAAKYLKTLYAMFGDWHLALASYNAGPGRVQQAMRRSGRDDFWSITARGRYLPRETRDYVPLILAAVVIARNPAEYGLTIAPSALQGIETVVVPGPVDLRRVADWAGTTVEVIQALNPELRRWTTPANVVGYELKVPAGTAEPVRAGLATASPEQLSPVAYHIVRNGETIAGIARKLKVTRSDLAEANFLSSKARLTPGQQLIIPKAPPLERPADPPASAPSPATVASEAPTAPVQLTHRVQPGDTLFSIARRYGTSVASLQQLNQLRGTLIQAGQRLTVLAGPEAAF